MPSEVNRQTMSGQDARKELTLLVNSEYPLIYLETWEEARATEILQGVACDVGTPFYVWTVTAGLARHGGAPIYNSQQPLQVLATIASLESDGLFLLKDFHKYLSQDVVVRKLRDLIQDFRRARRSVVISAPVVTLPVELEKDTAKYTLALPDITELQKLVTVSVSDLGRQHRFVVEFPRDGLADLARNLRGLTLDEARRILSQAILERSRFDRETVARVLSARGQVIKGQGVLEILTVEDGLAAIGGLKRLKSWLEKRRVAFTPEADQHGLRPPKGILIFGVQGCGKSLCAKAVAREWGLQLLKFDTSDLFNKYVGESERNLRKSLQVAEAVAPSVLWIDEIEKMFPRALLTSDADAGLSARLFGSFLNWLQEKKSPVFVVATSNDISALPPELLRKGRFDEIFFVDLPDAAERQSIFRIHLQRHKQNPEAFDLATLVTSSSGFSGAEIEQAVSSALYSAFAQKSPLATETIFKELQSTYPISVTMKERIEALRRWAQARAVPAN